MPAPCQDRRREVAHRGATNFSVVPPERTVALLRIIQGLHEQPVNRLSHGLRLSLLRGVLSEFTQLFHDMPAQVKGFFPQAGSQDIHGLGLP